MPPKGKGSFDDGREVGLHQHVFSQDLKLTGNPAAVMEAMHTYISQQGHMMTFKPSKIEVALEVLGESKPKTAVELGTYVGFSTLAWGKMVKDFHLDLHGCRVISMEANEKLANIASDFVRLAGLDDVVEIMQGPSADSLAMLPSRGVAQVDYLFIDHWEKHYLPDLQLCEDLKLLHQGSVIVADNTDIPGAPEYVEYVKAGGRGKYEYHSRTYSTAGDQGHPNVLEVSVVA